MRLVKSEPKDGEISFGVTKAATRPAGESTKCFYCHAPIGDEHASDCVLISKKATIRFIIEYQVNVPNFWQKDNVEFHRNESSSCKSNILHELKSLSEASGCLCNANARFEFVSFDSRPFLKEE